MGFLDSLHDYLRKANEDHRSSKRPTAYRVAGRGVRCPHCAGSRFLRAEILMNTSDRTFLGIEWTDDAAHTLVCTECSRVEWFLEKPEVAPDEQPGNALAVIFPYKHEGLWVFDDERAGLVQEPFVSGADTLIDRALAKKGIDGDRGFRLVFSASEFPDHDHVFRWVREADGGNWYHSEDFGLEGWLCPALFKYFDAAPKELYARFESGGR